MVKEIARKKYPTIYMRERVRKFIHTAITPVAALTLASPDIVVAASVANAVAPIFTTLSTQIETTVINNPQTQSQENETSYNNKE